MCEANSNTGALGFRCTRATRRPNSMGSTKRGRARAGPVLARVQDLVPELGVVEVLGGPERALRLGLARLARHHQDDLAADVDPGVVVVAEEPRGNAVAGEGHVARQVPVPRE